MATNFLSRVPGGPKTLGAFLVILVAYTLQTESTQHIQHALKFERPLFLLYVTHSSFASLLPMQLLALRIIYGSSISHNFSLLLRDLHSQVDSVRELCHLSPSQTKLQSFSTLAVIIILLTLGITIPAVSWFVALPLTSMANVTSIYNTFSIWALVFSVAFLHEKWVYYQAIAVALGVVGVAMVAYGSTQPAANATMVVTPVVSHALIGNGMALLGAVTMAAYEILYKLIGTSPEASHAGFQPLASSEEHADLAHTTESQQEETLPFGMHAIAMTSGIGAATMLGLWLMLVIANFTGFETFELPHDQLTIAWICLGVMCGVLFNGCFSILLSLWGPVLASMSCLLTTVLVQLVDLFLGVPFTWITLVGCATITISFVCLLPFYE
ncbi:hypothetical protein MYAM1_001811 [Malassezia yamatoensis]|uniref:EamA domain-containing protein n=1 Tax=Malassezia yamatoensis TaxID=253288 RepID=A0AAJ5YS07_9BASI|nr:hypothetical protein MYAM1_001811 [Malassezia yamatoensis]